MIQLCVVTASFLLGMFFYPFALKKWTQFVEWLYWISMGKADEAKPEDTPKTALTPTEKLSVTDQNKLNSGHSRTKTSETGTDEKGMEKEHTFAPNADDEAALMDGIDHPLLKTEQLTREEFDSQKEEVELAVEPGAVLASGVSYDELIRTRKVIDQDNPSEQDKAFAGRVLYENESTEILEQIVSKDDKTRQAVNTLIAVHLKQYNSDHTDPSKEFTNSDDVENINIEQLF